MGTLLHSELDVSILDAGLWRDRAKMYPGAQWHPQKKFGV
jgi:hypothetical protein